jgi:hypothetical protein
MGFMRANTTFLRNFAALLDRQRVASEFVALRVAAKLIRRQPARISWEGRDLERRD